MSRLLKIQMPDATWLSIDQDEWRLLACPMQARPRSDKKTVIDQLCVRRHGDGRFLVYVVLESAAGELPTVAGEVVSDHVQVLYAVQRIAKRFSLPEVMVNGCAAVLSNPPLP